MQYRYAISPRDLIPALLSHILRPPSRFKRRRIKPDLPGLRSAFCSSLILTAALCLPWALSGCTGYVTAGTSQASTTAQLTLSTAVLAFGNQALNTTSTQTLTLSSSGTAALTINSVNISGTGFSIPAGSFPMTLDPGQTAAVLVAFKPATAGAANGTLTISSNSTVGGTETVGLSGMGTSPQLTLSTATLSFGNVAVNTTSALTLTLSSSGTAPVTVDSATIAGAGFAMSSSTFPTTLNPGQTLSLMVSFSPTAAGAGSGTATISSNSSTGNTATVVLSGTGASPQLTVNASTLAFGSVSLNTTSTETLELTSSGTAPVTVNSATLAGAEFALTGGTFPTTLNPGLTLSLQVSFHPTAAGSASGTITLSSNSFTGGTTTVNLSGTGTANPLLALSTSSLAFGNDPIGTPVTLPVTLTSTGTSPVTVNTASLAGTGFTFSGATFPVTLNPTIAITIQVQFDPTATGTAAGTLTFSSNSTTGSTSVVNLSGNGTAVQHRVSLTWAAPANSPVPITNYNIYKATGSSTTYQLLGSASNTAYVDLAVQTSTTYSYYVTSVDSSGTESVPSNYVTVTVP